MWNIIKLRKHAHETRSKIKRVINKKMSNIRLLFGTKRRPATDTNTNVTWRWCGHSMMPTNQHVRKATKLSALEKLSSATLRLWSCWTEIWTTVVGLWRSLVHTSVYYHRAQTGEQQAVSNFLELQSTLVQTNEQGKSSYTPWVWWCGEGNRGTS